MRKRNQNSVLINFLFRKRILLGTILLVSLIIFAGISWNKFFIAHSKWVPKEGGIFTDSVIGEIKNISPLAPQKSLLDFDLKQLIFAGLLQYNPITGSVEDGLATLRISENGKTYFLTIKDSAKFSNGELVTIDDILFTYEEVIQNPGFNNDALKNAFEYITLDVIDKKTISFNLPEPNTYFSSLLTTPILRKKSYKNALIEEINDAEFPANKNPINAGPYILKNITYDEKGLMRVFLERNKYFFAGKPFIKQLVLYVYKNFDYLANSQRWTTMYSHLSTQQIEKIEPILHKNKSTREYVLPRFVGIFFNLDNQITNNPHLRDALKMTIDKDNIISREKGWKKIDSVFFFEGIEDWQEKDYPAARSLLRDKGFKYNKKKKIRTYKEKPVKLKMITSTAPSIYSRFAQNIARIWEKELDISVELDVLNPIDFQAALKKRDYDMVFFGQNFSENPDSLSSWHSSQSGKLNLANLTNPDVDFLIEEVRFTGALSDLLTLNQKLDEVNPIIAVATPKYYIFVENSLLGFSENFGKIRKHSERFFGIEKWYFEQKKDWDLPKNKSKISEYLSWLFNKKKQPELDYREKMPDEIIETEKPSDEEKAQ